MCVALVCGVQEPIQRSLLQLPPMKTLQKDALAIYSDIRPIPSFPVLSLFSFASVLNSPTDHAVHGRCTDQG
jgi:hypothetical protein